jgi:AcrR family transcriptional regulator
MKPVTTKRPTRVEPRSEPSAGPAADSAEAPRRGRPLARDRSAAILAATIALVDESGYDHLTIQDVATRAGVGLATIYRRWPNKQALFVEALRAKPVDLPDTGDVRADLVEIFALMAGGLQGDKGQLVPGCLAVGRDEPEILQALRDNAVGKMRAHLRRLIASEVGEDDPDLELRVDFGPGVLLHRAMLYGETVDDPAVFERMADLVLRPTAPAVADQPTPRPRARRRAKA